MYFTDHEALKIMNLKKLSTLFISSGFALASLLAEPNEVKQHDLPLDPSEFQLPDGLEISIWAKTPLFYNPTNIDMDHQGRMWIAEGRNYRGFKNFKETEGVQHLFEKGDRIVVVEDRDGDGVAEHSHVFYQGPELVAPLGLAVIGNKILISQPPDLIQITDVNHNAVYDEGIDKKEVLMTGFMGKDHDHSLHSVTVGPNGQYYFNHGNCGSHVQDRSGWTLKATSAYGNYTKDIIGQKSSDGKVYVGGTAMRMNPNATGLRPIGFNFRNSYEQTISSFGDVFQNDNDDPPACRTTWLMEYGNLGFFSNDGSRYWRVDALSDQSRGTAEWRQEVPGIIPAGDIYGGGAPTGIAYYENGPLAKWLSGTVITCEPSRNTLFQYKPRLNGAGFPMNDRSIFLTSNTAQVFAGSDFIGGNKGDGFGEHHTLFRPSDVMVGPDGAIYVSDWFDQRVGGHATLDKSRSGFIYRITPKGQNLKTPKLDLKTTAGQLAAFQSPAVNTRAIGFYALKAQGEKVIPQIKTMLDDDNVYLRARALWLLAQLGTKGAEIVTAQLDHKAPQMRITAFRALRFINHHTLKHAAKLAKDNNIAVRREVALALRYEPFEKIEHIFKDLYTRMDPEDRWYIEALGTAVDGDEEKVYQWLKKQPKQKGFDKKYAKMVWRLHPDSSIDELLQWAMDSKLSYDTRRSILFAIAYTESEQASDSMVKIAKSGPQDTKNLAKEFILKRMPNLWQAYKPMERLTGVKASEMVYQDAIVPDSIAPERELPPKAEILALKGDVKRGELAISRCTMCHVFGKSGASFGPTLTGWGAGQTREVILNSIIDPSLDIAHGFKGVEVETKSGKKIQGFLDARGDPTIVRIFGGSSMVIYKKDIKRIKNLKHSLMIPGSKMGLSAQEIRDIIEYMKFH